MLSDNRMPNITEFQLARGVKKINPDLKIIRMSAFEITNDEFSQVMPSTVVDDIIKKPAKLSVVKSVLLKHIDQTKMLCNSESE